MNRNILAYLFVAALILCPLLGPPCLSYVSVTPITVFLIMDPGSSWTGTLNLTSSEPFSIAVEVVRSDYVNYGSKVDFPKPGSLNWSCTEWLELPVKSFKVPPNSTFALPFKVTVPKGVRAGDYHGLILLEITRAEAAGGGVSVKFRIGTLIAIRVRGKKVLACEGGLVSSTKSDSSYEVVLRCVNKGNALVRVKPRLVASKGGEVIFTLTGVSALVYPGYWYDFKLSIPLDKISSAEKIIGYFEVEDVFDGEKRVTNFVSIPLPH